MVAVLGTRHATTVQGHFDARQVPKGSRVEEVEGAGAGSANRAYRQEDTWGKVTRQVVHLPRMSRLGPAVAGDWDTHNVEYRNNRGKGSYMGADTLGVVDTLHNAAGRIPVPLDAEDETSHKESHKHLG